MARFRKSSCTQNEFFKGKHRFEHWYRDNTVCFITSKVRDGLHAFATEPATQIFWNRFDHYRAKYNFIPWVATLLGNHYHIVGYLKTGENLRASARTRPEDGPALLCVGEPARPRAGSQQRLLRRLSSRRPASTARRALRSLTFL